MSAGVCTCTVDWGRSARVSVAVPTRGWYRGASGSCKLKESVDFTRAPIVRDSLDRDAVRCRRW
jgi:hypothetical protein